MNGWGLLFSRSKRCLPCEVKGYLCQRCGNFFGECGKHIGSRIISTCFRCIEIAKISVILLVSFMLWYVVIGVVVMANGFVFRGWLFSVCGVFACIFTMTRAMKFYTL